MRYGAYTLFSSHFSIYPFSFFFTFFVFSLFCVLPYFFFVFRFLAFLFFFFFFFFFLSIFYPFPLHVSCFFFLSFVVLRVECRVPSLFFIIYSVPFSSLSSLCGVCCEVRKLYLLRTTWNQKIKVTKKRAECGAG